MEASESYTPLSGTANVPVTFHGHVNGDPADSLHVPHDDGSETVLPRGVTVLVPAAISEHLMSDENQAVYRIERD